MSFNQNSQKIYYTIKRPVLKISQSKPKIINTKPKPKDLLPIQTCILDSLKHGKVELPGSSVNEIYDSKSNTNKNDLYKCNYNNIQKLTGDETNETENNVSIPLEDSLYTIEEITALLIFRYDNNIDLHYKIDINRAFKYKDKNGNTTLMNLFDSKEINIIKKCIDKIPKDLLFIKNAKQQTVLDMAIELDFTNIAIKLIDRLVHFKMNLNYKVPKNKTLLVKTICNQKEDIAVHLINSGIDITIDGNFNTIPVTTAVMYGLEKVVKVLIDKGATINVITDYGFNSLIEAIVYKKGKSKAINMAKEILSIKTPLIIKDVINKADENGTTPLMWSISKDLTEITYSLIDNIDIKLNDKDKNNRSALFWAINYRQPETVKKILAVDGYIYSNKSSKLINEKILYFSELVDDDDITINIINNYNNSWSLFRCMEKKWFDLAKSLLKRGWEYTKKNKKGETIFFNIINNRQFSLATYILKFTKNKLLNKFKSPSIRKEWLNQKNNFEMTPLCIAIKKGDKILSKLIIQENVDLDTQNYGAPTELMLALKYDETEEIATLLIKKGADIFKTNSTGKNSIDLAKDYNRSTIISLIQNKLDKSYEINLKKNIKKTLNNLNTKKIKIINTLFKYNEELTGAKWNINSSFEIYLDIDAFVKYITLTKRSFDKKKYDYTNTKYTIKCSMITSISEYKINNLYQIDQLDYLHNNSLINLSNKKILYKIKKMVEKINKLALVQNKYAILPNFSNDLEKGLSIILEKADNKINQKGNRYFRFASEKNKTRGDLKKLIDEINFHIKKVKENSNDEIIRTIEENYLELKSLSFILQTTELEMLIPNLTSIEEKINNIYEDITNLQQLFSNYHHNMNVLQQYIENYEVLDDDNQTMKTSRTSIAFSVAESNNNIDKNEIFKERKKIFQNILQSHLDDIGQDLRNDGYIGEFWFNILDHLSSLDSQEKNKRNKYNILLEKLSDIDYYYYNYPITQRIAYHKATKKSIRKYSSLNKQYFGNTSKKNLGSPNECQAITDQLCKNLNAIYNYNDIFKSIITDNIVPYLHIENGISKTMKVISIILLKYKKNSKGKTTGSHSGIKIPQFIPKAIFASDIEKHLLRVALVTQKISEVII
jgi:ankyrin repeat protein